MTRPIPILKEMSGRSREALWTRYFGMNDMPAHILRSEGFASAGVAGLFELYDEMEEKDGHLFSVLQTRKNGVLSCRRKILAASNAPRDQKIAQSIEEILAAIPCFDQALLNILDAMGKGLSLQEVVWEVRGGGRIGVRELKSRAPGRFSFGEDGSLRLNTFASPASSSGAGVNAQTGLSRALNGEAMPERKFLRFTFGGLYDNAYGRGLCARAYWYYWFKKNNLKFWVIYNEKFGAPTIVGKYRPGSSEEDRSRLFEVVESLQNDTGVTVPESMSLELLEAQRAGNASTYRDLADWCNDEISKIVLGATLTSGEGRRSGSLALGEVHERVRGEYIDADARALENVINNQLIRWLVDFNFGVDVVAPRWVIDTTGNDALASEIALDKDLIAAGVALPEKYFYEKYQRPAPIGDEPTLRYDDKNLFQYHLRFGVLTINEARRRLGLAPVPWGEERTLLPASPQGAGEGSGGELGSDAPTAETSQEQSGEQSATGDSKMK